MQGLPGSDHGGIKSQVELLHSNQPTQAAARGSCLKRLLWLVARKALATALSQLPATCYIRCSADMEIIVLLDGIDESTSRAIEVCSGSLVQECLVDFWN